jgi:type III pantothenate kinase
VNLIVDIGNTRVKTCVFDLDELVDTKVFDELDFEALQDLVKAFAVTHVIFASTGAKVHADRVQVSGVVLELTPGTPIPIEYTYQTPATLGQDRLAGMVAASWLHPDSDVLVIDAGTCITYDVLEKSGTYVGGNIAPGLDMRFKAMHTFTKRLPSIERPDTISLLGQSTIEAMQNGGLLGVLMEVAGYIEMLRGSYTKLKTLLTGGDASFLAGHLKAEISVQPNLVLIGLNQILNFNVAKYN